MFIACGLLLAVDTGGLCMYMLWVNWWPLWWLLGGFELSEGAGGFFLIFDSLSFFTTCKTTCLA